MRKTLRKTKLVCTIGPATRSRETLEKLVRAGMNVARLNFSYDRPEAHAEVIDRLRKVSAKLGKPTAILMDLPGTKVRTGELDQPQVVLKTGEPFSIVREPIRGNARHISINLPQVLDDLKAGNIVFINDGAIQLKVLSVDPGAVRCRVVVGGPLVARKGVNVPGVRLNVPSITDDDLRFVLFGIEHEVDFIGVSFVRSAEDVNRVRQFQAEHGGRIPLIAKIEKHEAVTALDSIIQASDGVMVARGDLGVEIPLEHVPIVQKRIVLECSGWSKPVIVATQMLESMINSVRPTRAEVSDVANAIYDGADAVMLSGETAVGSYPVEAVKMMAKVACETEKVLPNCLKQPATSPIPQIDDAISFAACQMAQSLNAACIVAYTHSGSTAIRVSRYRPGAPILALTPDERVQRRLLLSWGVQPHRAPAAADVDAMFEEATRVAQESGMARKGDVVVITAGAPVGVPGTTNLLKAHRIR